MAEYSLAVALVVRAPSLTHNGIDATQYSGQDLWQVPLPDTLIHATTLGRGTMIGATAALLYRIASGAEAADQERHPGCTTK